MFTRFFSSLSFFRLLSCLLAISFGFTPLRAANEPDDDMKETEEEACGPLQIKSQTELCSADYLSREEVNRTRKTIEKEKI